MTVSISSAPIARSNPAHAKPDPTTSPRKETAAHVSLSSDTIVKQLSRTEQYGPLPRNSGDREARAAKPTRDSQSPILIPTRRWSKGPNNKKPTRASLLFSKGHFPDSLRNPDGSPAAQRGSAVGRGGIGKARDGVKQFFKILSLSTLRRHFAGNLRRRT